MIQHIQLSRSKQTCHVEVLDVCEAFAQEDERSVTSAMVKMLKSSSIYKRTLARLQENGQRGNNSSRE